MLEDGVEHAANLLTFRAKNKPRARRNDLCHRTALPQLRPLPNQVRAINEVTMVRLVCLLGAIPVPTIPSNASIASSVPDLNIAER